VVTRKAIFLDVDGTYAHQGVAPAVHEEAVRTVRAAGHLVLLCSGRPASMLSSRLLAPGFDGIIASAGGYVEIGGRVLEDHRFPPEVAARIVSVLLAHDLPFVLEAPERVYGPLAVDRHLGTLLRSGGPDILDALEMKEDLSKVSFSKASCFDSPLPISVLLTQMGLGVEVIASSLNGTGGGSAEFYLPGVHKARGMRTAIGHLGVSREDTIAAGDGPNDIEMIDFAGTGVAIEGGHTEVLVSADFTVPGPKEAGLLTAFIKLGLL
jgi:hydroxymethylpyrimidine pyrophosphatase-like HAD family hydrolase